MVKIWNVDSETAAQRVDANTQRARFVRAIAGTVQGPSALALELGLDRDLSGFIDSQRPKREVADVLVKMIEDSVDITIDVLIAAMKRCGIGALAVASNGLADSDHRCMVLGLGATKTDKKVLDIDQEFANLRKSVLVALDGKQSPWASKETSFVPVLYAGISDFNNGLARLVPRIIHISAHATPDAVILIEKDGGGSKLFADVIVSLLSSMTVGRPELVVLNCCYTAEIARRVQSDGRVKFVIGTNTNVGDSKAIAFSCVLYSNLALGRSLKEAFIKALTITYNREFLNDAALKEAEYTLTPLAGSESITFTDLRASL